MNLDTSYLYSIWDRAEVFWLSNHPSVFVSVQTYYRHSYPKLVPYLVVVTTSPLLSETDVSSRPEGVPYPVNSTRTFSLGWTENEGGFSFHTCFRPVTPCRTVRIPRYFSYHHPSVASPRLTPTPKGDLVSPGSPVRFLKRNRISITSWDLSKYDLGKGSFTITIYCQFWCLRPCPVQT